MILEGGLVVWNLFLSLVWKKPSSIKSCSDLYRGYPTGSATGFIKEGEEEELAGNCSFMSHSG